MALIATVTMITYFSVVLGDLVPKRLALQNPEGIDSTIAKPMQGLAMVVSPLVWLLSASSRLLLKALRLDRVKENTVTDEGIQIMMVTGSETGVFHAEEGRLVTNVMKLDKVHISAIMVPRKDIYLIDTLQPWDQQRQKIEDSPYSQIVICKGGFEQILGMLNCRDLIKVMLANPDFTLETILKPVVYVQETMTLTQLLKQFRKNRSDIALVINEYGDIEGLVIITDLLKAIIGELPAISADQPYKMVQQADCSWLVDGDMPIAQLKSTLGIKFPFPGETSKDYHTLAGIILFSLQKLPQIGDNCLVVGWKFEVVDMDGIRIDKVLVFPVPSEK